MKKQEYRKQKIEKRGLRKVIHFSIGRHLLGSSSSSRGFTLIETFVAITILVTAVAGPLTLASKGLQSAILARDQLVASFLAQEGIEFIREHRDNNALASPRPSSWLSGLDACVSPSTCIVDPAADTVVACTGACDVLRLDTVTGFYNYNASNGATQFTRTITIIPNANGREAVVSSTINWRTAVYQRSLTFKTNLTNWQ